MDSIGTESVGIKYLVGTNLRNVSLIDDDDGGCVCGVIDSRARAQMIASSCVVTMRHHSTTSLKTPLYF